MATLTYLVLTRLQAFTLNIQIADPKELSASQMRTTTYCNLPILFLSLSSHSDFYLSLLPPFHSVHSAVYASVQAALLYTTSSGERRIRSMTRCLPISSNVGDLYSGANAEAMIPVMLKLGT